MKIDNTLDVLDKYGEMTTKMMRNILIRNNKRASGNLINSIDYDITFKDGNQLEPTIDITFAPYGRYVAGYDKQGQPGHPPTWSRKGPPIQAIKMWLRNKSIAFNSLSRKLNLKGNYEKKLNILTYLIIRKIKKRRRLNPAYKNPTDFITPKETILNSKKFKKELIEAQKKDIEIELKKRFNVR